MDPDEFPLLVKGFRFDCYYQQGFFTGGEWKKSPDGPHHIAVCRCGCGVFGTSLQDAVDKLKASYSALRPTEHSHCGETVDCNVLFAVGKTWVMGTVRHSELLDKVIGIDNHPNETERKNDDC